MNIDLELRPIEREDLPQLRTWRNDWRIIAWTRQYDMLNEVEHANWFERQATDPAIRMYKIVMKAAGKTVPVGVCGLTSIDYRNSRAEFSCYIGPEFHRRGLGKMALSLLLTHGFDNLGLNLIWGETLAGNPAAIMFESLGFQREGTRRSFYYKDCKRLDAHLYSITAREWHVHRTSKPSADPVPSGDEPVGLASKPEGATAAGNVIDVQATPKARRKRREAETHRE